MYLLTSYMCGGAGSFLSDLPVNKERNTNLIFFGATIFFNIAYKVLSHQTGLIVQFYSITYDPYYTISKGYKIFLRSEHLGPKAIRKNDI